MTALFRRWVSRGLILILPVACMACSKGQPSRLPPPPAETVIAKVAIPVACEIEQVPVPSYPASTARKGDNVFTLAKTALADRRVRMGETEQLRAATANPCPGGE